MMPVVETLAVAAIVLAATLYATWALLPASVLRALLQRADAVLGPRVPRLSRRVLQPLLARFATGGCAACGGGTRSRAP
jgi:hypothetical protein